MRNKLTEMRKKSGYTQKDIAEQLGVSRSYYGMIENGARTPSLNTARRIADLFRSDINELFFD